MARTNFLNLEVYRLAEKLADEVWSIVMEWKPFARWTLGKQLVNSADGIGANIAEGAGRGSFQENRRFVRIARANLNETRHWLRRANKRNLLTQDHIHRLQPLIDELAPRLNAYLNSIGSSTKTTTKVSSNGPRTTDN